MAEIYYLVGWATTCFRCSKDIQKAKRKYISDLIITSKEPKHLWKKLYSRAGSSKTIPKRFPLRLYSYWPTIYQASRNCFPDE